MCGRRQLAENVWYGVRTEVNIAKPLFRLPEAIVLLHRVFRKVKGFYPFELRGLQLEGAWLTFYIKPEDGFQLPLIMQLVKQAFSVRFNRLMGRLGHVWGDRSCFAKTFFVLPDTGWPVRISGFLVFAGWVRRQTAIRTWGPALSIRYGKTAR